MSRKSWEKSTAFNAKRKSENDTDNVYSAHVVVYI